MSGDDFWSRFDHDPRDPERSALRASDRDREHVHRLLGDAYAEGRLDVEELEERTALAQAARTLGELPPLVLDLVPPTTAGGLVRRGADGALTDVELVTATPDRLRARAAEEYEAARRSAVVGFVGPTLICWTIWLATSIGPGFDPQFPWPLIVMAPLLANLARLWLTRDSETEERLRRLERRQRMLREGGTPADDAGAS